MHQRYFSIVCLSNGGDKGLVRKSLHPVSNTLVRSWSKAKAVNAIMGMLTEIALIKQMA